MDDREVAEYWNENAPDWIEAVRAGWDVYRKHVNDPAFFAMLPDLKGLQVLDVGCGEGCNSRRLADLGAHVVGIDVSGAMIAAAAEHERDEPRGIEYHAISGTEMKIFADESFDSVVSTMAMMDMSGYSACVREVSRVLKTGGVFQFSILHPCTLTRMWQWIEDDSGTKEGLVIGDYFSLGSAGRKDYIDQWFFSGAPRKVRRSVREFQIPRFFRTLAEYFNALTAADFRVNRMEEPYADAETAEKCPNVADTRIIPYFLILQCSKE